MPDPVGLFGGVERIEIEHGFPCRIGLAVLVERGASPDAALVLFVFPEVVVVRTHLVDQRNARIGVEDFEDAGLQRRERWIGFDSFDSRRVADTHPVERLRRGHFFEPEIRINPIECIRLVWRVGVVHLSCSCRRGTPGQCERQR